MFEPIIASIIVMLVSLSGVFFFGRKQLIGAHRFILPVAVGVFLGIVFLELIPETLAATVEFGPLVILAGFFGFYGLSHMLRTFHTCSDEPCDTSRVSATMVLWGDAVHNIADGVVITSAFLVNPVLGVATTVGIVLHELPQEIAEFGILINGGYTRSRAAVLNLFSASSILLGTFITLLVAHAAEEYIWIITGIAAGNLLYIATSDLIPELRESHKGHFKTTFLSTILGVVAIAIMLHFAHSFVGEEHSHEHEEDAHIAEML